MNESEVEVNIDPEVPYPGVDLNFQKRISFLVWYSESKPTVKRYSL